MKKQIIKGVLASLLIGGILIQPTTSEATSNCELVAKQTHSNLGYFESSLNSLKNNLKLQSESNHPEGYKNIIQSTVNRINSYKDKIKNNVDNDFLCLDEKLSVADKLKINTIFGIQFDVKMKIEHFTTKEDDTHYYSGSLKEALNYHDTNKDGNDSSNEEYYPEIPDEPKLPEENSFWSNVESFFYTFLSNVEGGIGNIGNFMATFDTYSGYFKWHLKTEGKVIKGAYFHMTDVFNGGDLDVDLEHSIFTELENKWGINDDIRDKLNSKMSVSSINNPLQDTGYTWSNIYDSKNQYYLLNFMYKYDTVIFPQLLSKVKENGITEEIVVWHKEQVKDLFVKSFHMKLIEE